MTTGRPLPAYNYEDYVPVNGIVCPICDSPCSSLQLLNQHLDVAHNEEDTKGALLSWLKNAQKKVQTTLSSSPRPGQSPSNGPVERSLKQLIDPALMSSFQNLNLGNNSPAFFASDGGQGDFITREHWQSETGNDVCSLNGCTKILGKGGSGRQHCRQCGRLFCDAHTQYEIKLNRQARHDPAHGTWAKVCAGCFVGREGYVEHLGAMRNASALFLSRRAKAMERVYLERNRLEKRLEKLAHIHYNADMGISKTGRSTSRLANASPSLSSITLERADSVSSRDSVGSGVRSSKASAISSGSSILSMKLKYRDGEQTVTKWEDDRSVVQCPLCLNQFTLTNRKHHCRLCGRVVCGNIRCSRMIPLFLNMASDSFDEDPVGDTRACRDCYRAVFHRKLKHEESTRTLPIFHLYHQLSIARNNIERQLPRFHDMIVMLEQEKIVNQTHETYRSASQIRKSLLDSFALYDTLAKSIRTLPVSSASMKRLQTNISTAANMYLQRNMLPLQMLPRILKPEKKKRRSVTGRTPTENPNIEELHAQYQAYVEQYKLVEGFIQEAKQNRKYDDAKTLKASLEELRSEIHRLRLQLEQ
ncbi:FYVE zinc finger-domain-containing protein [Radiomyces spectabilis]|uniref:FYVE zinc finger-domain-containing protein n=1 Tax=Radiomyces spectabilis TaxID=64574 RepID=UPI00221EC3BA|nr:FYVE zinc finger-domain-containing protein [Radiomyces spectabilis]KAI8388681.1 FYVE zinc finger-domain-containing protein [Radiomyces spectabilis]